MISYIFCANGVLGYSCWWVVTRTTLCCLWKPFFFAPFLQRNIKIQSFIKTNVVLLWRRQNTGTCNTKTNLVQQIQKNAYIERMMKLDSSLLECTTPWNYLLSVVLHDGGPFCSDCCGVGYSLYWLSNISYSCVRNEKIQNYKLSFWHLHCDNKEIIVFLCWLQENSLCKNILKLIVCMLHNKH